MKIRSGVFFGPQNCFHLTEVAENTCGVNFLPQRAKKRGWRSPSFQSIFLGFWGVLLRCKKREKQKVRFYAVLGDCQLSEPDSRTVRTCQ